MKNSLGNAEAICLFILLGIYYFVAFSSFFIIEKMNRAESKQSAIRRVQIPHNGSLSQRSPGIDTK